MLFQIGLESNIAETSRELISIVVRTIGLFLLFAGLWVAIQVLTEALDLYRNPGNIERMAVAIEQGSNIDRSLVPLKDSLAAEENADASYPTQNRAETAPSPVTPTEAFRLSYFIAWVIAILLLLLIARIALATMKTGGELALYDVHVKRFARALISESARLNSNK